VASSGLASPGLASPGPLVVPSVQLKHQHSMQQKSCVVKSSATRTMTSILFEAATSASCVSEEFRVIGGFRSCGYLSDLVVIGLF
jgi:hypothetical protein